MGGYGSGRPATRVSIEGQRRLDVRMLRRRGWLHHGNSGTWTWSQAGEEVGAISYAILEGAVDLNYSISDDDDAKIAVRIRVPLVQTDCHFGGTRNYFRCPHCYRRCEVIVMTTNGRTWGCRKCLPLRYESQALAPAYRIQRRADALYSSAGRDLGDAFVQKHKWMRWRTFNRLMDRANRLSQCADAAFLYQLRRFGFANLEDIADHVSKDA
jgi:hypothetical protein